MMVSQKLRKVISRTYIHNKSSKELAAIRAVGLFIKSWSKMTVFPDFPLYNSACCTNTIINSAICTLENVLDFTINDLDALSMAPSHIILGSTSSSDPLLPHPLGILYLLFCPLAVFPCFLSVSCSEVTPLFSIQSSLLCNPIHSTQMILVND